MTQIDTDTDYSIGTLLDYRREKAVPAAFPELPYVGLEHIEAHTTRLLGTALSISMKSASNRFYKGDVLYSRLRPYLNKVWLADRDGLCSAEFIVLPENEFVDSAFLRYRLSARDFVQFANSLNAGDRPRVDFDQISCFILPAFTLAYQRRIVAKIEELFSELDQGIETLKKARAQLAVYRQALLKHAFEGKLTTEWRAAHADELESEEELLGRIQAERDSHYQKRLTAWKALNLTGVNNASKPRQMEAWDDSSLEESENLPALPDGWAWTALRNLCQTIRNGISAKPEGDSGDKILRISAVRPMKIDLSDFRYLQSAKEEYESYVLEFGDLLFTRYNGTRKFVGVCGCFKGAERRLFPDKLIQARLGVDSVLPGMIEAAFASGATRKFVESRIRTTAGQAGISGGDIKAAPVPVCCVAEQREIVRILAENLSNIDALEADIDLNLQKAEALRQSILKKAFAGELVPQDPADEPASELLARIRAEREAAVASPRTARKVTRKTQSR